MALDKGVVNKFKEYKSEDFPFPSTEIKPEEKHKPEYCKSCAEAIYSRHIKGRTGVTYSYTSLFGDLRAYGLGLQSEDKYKRWLNSSYSDKTSDGSDIDGAWTSNREYDRKGWANMVWDIVSPAGKIRAMIKGLFDEIDFDVMADAIDADSGAEEEDRKWRLWAMTRAEIRTNLDRMKMKAGIPLDRPQFTPSSIEELEMFQAAGGFKVGYAMAMEKLLKHTADISNWDDLKDKILEDLIDLNVAFAKEEFDEDSDKSKWRYVDPEDMVIQYSKYEDFRDAEYAGEFKEMKLSALKQKMLQAEYSEEDIKTIAQDYMGLLGNPSQSKWDDYNTESASGIWRYDNFNVVVFNTEWIDSDKTKKIKYVNKYGKTRFLDYEEGKKPTKKEELVASSKGTLYGCTWIVGTKVAFDHGPVYWQPKPSLKTVELTYRGVKIPGKSLTQTLTPIYDDIQKGWLQYQNACAVAFNDGYVIDWGMIQNISDGDKKFSPLEVIKMFKETSIMPFRSTPVGQAYYRGGATVPIQKVQGGMGESLNQAVMRLQIQFKLVEDLTGLSPVSLGSSPDPNAPVQTTERSLQSTHNALKPMIRGIFKLKDMLARSSSIKIQQLCKWDEQARKEYEKVIGESDVMALVEAKDSSVEYGIKLEARPTSIDKTDMLRAAEIALQPGRDGVPGISYDDYLYVKERINAGGNLKEIRFYLAFAKKKASNEAFQKQQALIQQQTEGNKQMKEMEVQKDMMTKKLDVEGQIAIDNNKFQNERSLKLMDINKTYIQELEKQAAAEQAAAI